MLIIDKISNKNKVFRMFFRKVKEHTEKTEIKVNIDIFYELFRSIGYWMLTKVTPLSLFSSVIVEIA